MKNLVLSLVALGMVATGSLSTNAANFKCMNLTSHAIIEFHENQPTDGLATLVSGGQSSVVKLTISSATLGRSTVVTKTFFHPYFEYNIEEVYGEENTRTAGLIVQSSGFLAAEMQEPQSVLCESIFQKIGP